MNRTMVSLLLAASSCWAAEAPAQAIHFEIAEQSLASALTDFAHQSDRPIFFSSDIVDGKRIRAIRGDYEPAAALTLLLRGTGLVFKVLPDRTIMVQSAERVHAQPTAFVPAAAGAPEQSSDSTGASEEHDSSEVHKDEVIVRGFRATTATKTDLALTETPQAISVITADDITARGALGLQEALRYTAGVRTEMNGSDLRFDYFSSRGFSATDYLDGMVRADSYNTARTDIYTLERVEVLRGPSSVLYGQGTAGGIVNSISKRPQQDFHAEGSVEYGSYNRKQAQFDVTGPLMDSGELSGRLVSVFRRANNQFDFGRDDRFVIAPSLRWRPGERTDITFLSLYQKDTAASVFAYLPLAATLDAPPGRRLPDNRFLGEPDLNRFDRKQATESLMIDHHFTDNLTYSGGVRYSYSSGYDAGIYGQIWNGTIDPFIGPDDNLLPRYRYDWRVRSKVLTTDNRLAWKVVTGPLEHNFLGGVDYTHTDYQSAQAYAEGGPPLDVFNPVYGQGVLDAELSPYSTQLAKQLGFYVQDHVRFLNRGTVVVGARHDKVTTGTGSDEQVDRATTFRAGLTYEIIDGITPYFSYAQSFIPTIGVDFYGHAFKPQEGTQYEAGIKWQLDRATLLSVAAFNLTGTNRPQTDPENGQNTIQNGEVRSRGFEAEAIRRLPGDYSLSLSYTYIDMKITRATDPLEIGLPTSGVPKEEASLWGDKQFNITDKLSGHVGLGVRYMGTSEEAAVFSDSEVLRLKSPPFTLADALLGLSFGNSELTLNTTNLFDQRYYGSCSIRTACSVGYRRNIVARYTFRY